jgi:hypothetical protein
MITFLNRIRLSELILVSRVHLLAGETWPGMALEALREGPGSPFRTG